MDFGVATLTRGALGNRKGYVAVAEAAERLRYGFISVNDHIVVPRDIASRYPYSESGEWAARTAGDCLDQLATLAFLGGAHRAVAAADLGDGGAAAPSGAHRQNAGDHRRALRGPAHRRLRRGLAQRGVRGARRAADFDRRGGHATSTSTPSRCCGPRMHRCMTASTAVRDLMFLPMPVQKPHPPIWVGGQSGPRFVARCASATAGIRRPTTRRSPRHCHTAGCGGQGCAADGRGRWARPSDPRYRLHRTDSGRLDGAKGRRRPAAHLYRRSKRVGGGRGHAEAGRSRHVCLTFKTGELAETLERMQRFAQDVM